MLMSPKCLSPAPESLSLALIDVQRWAKLILCIAQCLAICLTFTYYQQEANAVFFL